MTHPQVEQQDIVERYLMDQLPPELKTEFEEHYIGCRNCVDELESTGRWIDVVRKAFAAENEQTNRWGRRFLVPLPAWGLVAAAVALAVYVGVGRHQAPRPPAATWEIARNAEPANLPIVELETYRTGRDEQARIAASAAGAFRLRLDLRGLKTYEQYLVRIVSDSGEAAWSSQDARPSGTWLEATVDGARLKAGSYWVRVFGVEAGGQPEFLREYSLVVAP